MDGFGGEETNPQIPQEEISSQGQTTNYSRPVKEELGKIISDQSYILDEIRNQLLGYIYTKEGWKKLEMEPILNDEGINLTISILEGYINPVNMTTQLTEDRINKMTIQFAERYCDMLKYNWRTWDMDPSKISQILVFLTAMIHLSLSKNEKNREGRGAFVGHLTQFRTEVMKNQNQRKKFMGVL